MLAEHPEVLSNLRSEILRVVGPLRRPTYDDFREMKYLRVRLYAYPIHPTDDYIINGAI